jgi:hypothetical protein
MRLVAFRRGPCRAALAVPLHLLGAVERQGAEGVDGDEHGASGCVNLAGGKALAQRVQHARLIQVGEVCEIAAGSQVVRYTMN